MTYITHRYRQYSASVSCLTVNVLSDVTVSSATCDSLYTVAVDLFVCAVDLFVCSYHVIHYI